MYGQFRKPGAILVFLVLFGLTFSIPLMAQNRIIKGKVVNEAGDPIADAPITIEGIDIRREYNVKTDKKGEYFYMGIPYGNYRVVIRAKGYAADFVANVRPQLGSEAEVNFTLKPGDPNQKLSFELTPEEMEKLREDMKQAEERRAASAEVKAFFDAGLQLAQQGKYDEAIVEYQKALEKDPDQAYIQANLGEAYSKMGKNEEALAAYQKAVSLKPNDAAIYTNLGVILGRLGKTAESQEAFKKAASLNPGAAAQNFYNLGATLVNSGQAKEAAEAFRQAISSDPNYAEAYYQLGICLSGEPENMAEAVKMLQKYIEIGKNPDEIAVAKQLISALQPQN